MIKLIKCLGAFAVFAGCIYGVCVLTEHHYSTLSFILGLPFGVGFGVFVTAVLRGDI